MTSAVTLGRPAAVPLGAPSARPGEVLAGAPPARRTARETNREGDHEMSAA